MLNTFLFQYSLSYLFAGLILAFLAVFAFFKSPGRPVNRTFAVYSSVIAWWAVCSILMINSPSEFWGTLWDRICLMGVVFIPSTFIHFNFTFLEIERKYRSFILANYLISALFFIANFTPFLVAGTSPKFGLNFYTDPGPLYLPFVVFFFGLSALGIVAFFQALRKTGGIRRRQIAFLFWATLLGYSMGGFNYNLSFGMGPPVLGLLGNYAITLYGIVVAYTITKHRLMDISVIISRFVAEVLTVFILGSIYLGLIWFYINFVSPLIGIAFVAWTFVYGILVGQIHQRIRISIQTTSDKVFLRGKYDYYKELSEISLQVGEKLSLAAILRILYRTFYDVIEIGNPRIFLPVHFSEPERTSNRYVPYDKETLLLQKTGEHIKFDDPLVKELISSRTPINDPHDAHRELIVPCLLEDRLIAIFVLGRKLSEDPYTNEDIRLLEVLASQAAMALDHTRSYEKIKVDLEVAERQMARSQRLASLGTLTAGVTHEIRNPLTVIRSEADRLAKKERSLTDLKQYRELVLKHVDRIAGIIQRMLSMAKEKPKEQKEVDINMIINSALQLVSLNGIKLKKELGQVAPVTGDPVGVEEIFVNLIQNAVQAMAGQGTLTIKTYTEDGRVVAEVSDTGKGIPEDIREKIFDPFFSTRHEGVGLGLSIAYRIIREHGGDISVSSQEGRGTTFKLSF
ncbi:ATP-binding protein [Candidatus Margulisiibacteriota bacterium]